MKASLNWIKEYTSINSTPEELKVRLSTSLTEIENIERFDERYEGIVVARVDEVKKHPESEKLLIIVLDVGSDGKKQVIVQQCPVKVGDLVPFLKPGLIFPEAHGLEKESHVVKDTTIAGVKSEGMVPSGREMGLNNDHTTVYTIESDVEPGTPVAQALDLVDHILEIKNKALTHRPDTFSVIGIAREIHAVQEDSEFSLPKWLADYEQLRPKKEGNIPSLPLEVKNEAEALCKRYMAIVIDGVKVKPSPQWLQIRLSKMGIRPVNNVVDISNYLMIEAGQPNHAFDYDKVVAKDLEQENKAIIKVRMAQSGESIVTLDGQHKELYDDTIIISDSQNPIGIAGVMGGKDTEITEETKTVIFQVENLDMYSIRRTSMKVGISSDAVTRFSKGLDPNLCEPIMYKGVEMLCEIAGGTVVSELIDLYPSPVRSHHMNINTQWLRNIIGGAQNLTDLDNEKIINILQRLGINVEVVEDAKDELKLEIPTYRKDLQIREDILEEVVRIYGYNELKPTLPLRTIKPVERNIPREIRMRIKQFLKTMGATEMYTYSFVGKDLYEKLELGLDKLSKLKNPLSPDLSYMRSLLAPSLLEKIPQNLGVSSEIAAFEIDIVNPEKREKGDKELPHEPWHLSLVHTLSYYHAKLYLDGLVKALNIKNYKIVPYDGINKTDLPKWIQAASNMNHPTRMGYIVIDDRVVGLIGQVDSDSTQSLSLPSQMSMFELRIEDIYDSIRYLPDYKEPSKYPSVVQDFCFELESGVSYSNLEEAVWQSNKSMLIRSVECIDIYQENENASNKRITLRVEFQSDEKTLAEADIESSRSAIIASVTKETAGRLFGSGS